MKKGLFVFQLVFVLLWLVSVAQATPSYVNRDIQVGPLCVKRVYLNAGQTYTIYTTGRSPGADPVMHLWGWVYDQGSYREGLVWSNDDSFNPDCPLGAGSCAAPNSRMDVSITYSGWYTIIIHDYYESGGGTADVYVDLTQIADDAAFTRKTIEVNAPGSSTYQFETSLATNGITDTVLLALECSTGVVKDFNDDGGVGLASKASGSNICHVIVGSYNSSTGTTHLYTNDAWTDSDGDGLGEGLENALNTCNSKTDMGCSTVIDPADTDHDGLNDNAEVFGVDLSASGVYLPAWGADPRHKDIFIEVDYTQTYVSGNHPFGQTDTEIEQSAKKLRDYFLAGTASVLKNPDGQNGINVHFDIGKVPTDPSLATLYGNWGGSDPNLTTGISVRDAYLYYFTPQRQGFFWYVFSRYTGGNSYAWGSDPVIEWKAGICIGSPNEVLAHEMGHIAGLAHWGHDSWGKSNYKPHYKSIMNYAFRRMGLGFSTSYNSTVLNPAMVDENSGIGSGQGQDPTYLQYDPFYLFIATPPFTEVDWNRSGSFDAFVLRTPLTWHNTELGAVGQNLNHHSQRQTLKDGEILGTTPKLIRAGNRLYAFYVGSDKKIYYTHGTILLASTNGHYGSCQAYGDTLGSANCVPEWTNPAEISFFDFASEVKAFSVVWGGRVSGWGDKMYIAYVKDDDSIYTASAEIAATGQLTNFSTVYFSSLYNTYVYPSKEIELAWVKVNPAKYDGHSIVLGLFYIKRSSGFYFWHIKKQPASSWISKNNMSFQRGGDTPAEEYGRYTPTLLTWPDVSSASVTCGAFVPFFNNNEKVELFCLDATGATEYWKKANDFPNGITVETEAKPGLVYHHPRLFNGQMAYDISLGQFILTTVNGGISWARLSRMLSSTDPPGPQYNPNPLFLSWRTFYGPHHILSGAGISLYEDPQIAATKGLCIDSNKLQLLPVADGTFRASLKTGNDFEVMEPGVCRAIQRDYTWPCAPCTTHSDCPSGKTCDFSYNECR